MTEAKNQDIIFTAETPMNFIDWKKQNVLEPIFTVKISVDSTKKLVEVPLTMESYSTDKKSCDRSVQEVSEEQEAVYSEDKRDGWVRAQVAHREILPVFESQS